MEISEAAATATKRARRASDGVADADADRLSALPDSLLHAIMSFLKARQAVQTCVLATRWRHLWRSVPCLDVDLDEFRCRTAAPAAAAAASSRDRDKKQWEDFDDFTSSLMHRRDVAQLESLSLRVPRRRAPVSADRQAGGWLRRAMKSFSSSRPWRLKRLHLCNVALDARFGEHVSSAACQSLEDLELEQCTLAFRALAPRLLKSLVLKSCWWRSLSEITSPTLKRLVVAGGSTNVPCCVVLAPAIAHLCLDVPLSFDTVISVNPMPSLPSL